MARDYARTRGGRKKRRRRPAVRRRRNTVPGWVWLICGICIGLAAAAGIYVFGRPGAPELSPAADGGGKRAEDDSAQAGETKTDKKPRFAFYEMLPNYEVVIPEEEYEQGESGATTSPKVREPGRYLIQAGSFSSYADADRRKAELALLGLESEIEGVELEDGRTVYRVRSAPIEKLERLNATLKRLRENDIDTLVMKARES